MTHFKLRNKPVMPIRGSIRKSVRIPGNTSLKEAVNQAIDLELEQCYIVLSNGSTLLSYCEPEPDFLWIPKLKCYKLRLADWQLWHFNNTEAIAAEGKRRAKAKVKKREQMLVKKERALLEQKAQLEKDLKQVRANMPG